jgi:hypothetical protein
MLHRGCFNSDRLTTKASTVNGETPEACTAPKSASSTMVTVGTAAARVSREAITER